MANTIQHKRGTEAEWAAADPTLAAGQVGVETDTGKFKVGDGSTAWSALGYFEADAAYAFQGSSHGYNSGGYTLSPAFQAANNVFKFSFASSPTTSSDVGDLSLSRYFVSGNNSKENSYASGGRSPLVSPTYSNVLDKFPFGSDGNATDVGDLTRLMEGGAGQSSETDGYQTGGYGPTYHIDIQKFPFASDGNTTDVADLSPTTRGYSSAQSSLVHGYSSGGTPGVNIIEKFPFATDANATDVGDLATTLGQAAGQSSDTNGYSSGGLIPPNTKSNVIQKFPFATDANATDVGDLIFVHSALAGQSSTTNGYCSGGAYSSGVASDIIQSFSFSSDTNATDEGDLTSGRVGSAGTHI